MLIDIAISIIIIFSIVEFFIDTFENFSLWINKLNFILCFIYFLLLIRNYFLIRKSSL